MRYLALVVLVSCVARDPPVAPPPAPVWHPYVAPERRQLVQHRNVPPPPGPTYVLHLDPNRCSDPRIAEVQARCHMHGEPPGRVWYSCPRDMAYGTKEFARVEMNLLTYDCGLDAGVPATTARCDGGVIRGEITHRWIDDKSQQPREMEVTCP